MATNNSRESRSKGRPSDFNESSGAAKPGADAPQAPQLNKAAVLAMLKRAMPARGAGGQVRSIDGVDLTPTRNQRSLTAAIETKDIVMIDGLFGTGKTSWTCEAALRALIEKKVNRVCINAPAVTAGEEIGFLKGSADDKMLPHVNQILEAFDEFIGEDLRKKMCETGLIKIEPHAFMRGRSLRRTFFIFDECQNASGPNLMTALERLGNDSTFVFMGDNNQNDRTDRDSAFTAFIARFTQPRYADSIGHVQLTIDDVKRHALLKRIVENGDHGPLEGYESHKGARRQPGRHAPAPQPAAPALSQ